MCGIVFDPHLSGDTKIIVIDMVFLFKFIFLFLNIFSNFCWFYQTFYLFLYVVACNWFAVIFYKGSVFYFSFNFRKIAILLRTFYSEMFWNVINEGCTFVIIRFETNCDRNFLIDFVKRFNRNFLKFFFY